ncbi:MAG: type II toxin-antitoxin system RelE/ParE family toxin [Alphaproteobacteria bacterium]
MFSLHIQTLAEQDIIDIWRYSFENWGERQADRYHDQLTAAFRLIAENPEIGVRCNEVRPGYRKFPANRHLILYRISDATIHIIRVLGADMDYEAQL